VFDWIEMMRLIDEMICLSHILPVAFNRTEDEYQALVRRHQSGRYSRSIGYGSNTTHREIGPLGTLIRPKSTPKFEFFLKTADPSILCELASVSEAFGSLHGGRRCAWSGAGGFALLIVF